MSGERGFVKYIAIMGLILGAAFLSQQLNLFGNGETFTFLNKATGGVFKGAVESGKGFLGSGSDWAKENVFPKIGGEVDKRGELLKQEVEKEKEKISESILEKTKNYFSGIADAVVNPAKPQNCPEPAQGLVLPEL